MSTLVTYRMAGFRVLDTKDRYLYGGQTREGSGSTITLWSSHCWFTTRGFNDSDSLSPERRIKTSHPRAAFKSASEMQ